LTKEEMSGRTSHDARWAALREDGTSFPGEAHPAMVTLRTGRPCSNVIMGVHRPDDERVWISINTQPLFHPGETQPHAVVTSFSDVTERKRADAAIRTLHAELEERVRQRTRELDAVNQELEAFSYSVSHDLRAPLRAIGSFNRLLLEDHAAQLDDDGRRILERVQANAERMGRLIDDLLALSRVTRTALQRQPVNLSTIAREVAADLREAEPARQVDFSIAPDLVVDGDPALLRVALENLLANAWKFTSKHATARIELGAAGSSGELVYFVRDDGAGFEMRFADRLFGAFQRLHSAADFEGSGIGLATVQRIVHRHGGRIWAEGAPEKGATFFFTLAAPRSGVS
jgi:light-regulated signal transduction histidine kinase (bacteriophytochrome)